jgi:putative acetyltransferase
MLNILIAPETPDQPEVRRFFAASEAYMGALYPAESNHFVAESELVAPHVVFLVARCDGRAVGCGAVVCDSDRDGEIKRMWVDPSRRGGGIGVAMLDALIAAARARRLSTLRLETGISQPEAIGLYRRAGFVECGPFGSYQADPLSLFMELDLLKTRTA